MPRTETREEALDSYRYPVDLTDFADAPKHGGWFGLDVAPGDPLQTIGLETRFRHQERLYATNSHAESKAEEPTSLEDIAVLMKQLLDRLISDRDAIASRLDRLPVTVIKLVEDQSKRNGATEIHHDDHDAIPTSAPPAGPGPQRRRILVGLRNRIRDEEKVEGYENLCQLPIVNDLIAIEQDGRPVRKTGRSIQIVSFHETVQPPHGSDEPATQTVRHRTTCNSDPRPAARIGRYSTHPS